MKIILASASPRRKAILENYGYQLSIMPSNYEENINGLVYSDILIENCAYQKALDVKNKIGDNILILSADTVVVCDGLILGKPKDENEAIEMLLKLSDKTHFVSSAICLLHNGKILKANEKTYVTFRKLTKNDILKYITDKKPFDKAGSYGIQDDNFDFVIRLNGELDNVIGFPMSLFKKQLSLLI